MDAWTTFWGWLLVGALAVFSILAITITIGGFFDVKGMLTTMNDQHEQDELANDNPNHVH